MVLWKVSTQAWTVRSVECEGTWPKRDADGDTVFVNTHFEDEGDAWTHLLREAEAVVSVYARALAQARGEVRRIEEALGDAANALESARQNRDHAKLAKGGV